MNEMHAAQMQNKATIMSLPEGLFCNIGSWLDDRDSCKMEVASKDYYSTMHCRGLVGLQGGSSF